MSGAGGPTREGPFDQGPPYPPRNHGLGGDPDVIPDVPITAIFLVLYLVFGIIHIKILKANKGRGHKFLFNGAILGLCKVRLITMSLRIAWACHPKNIGVGMAANVFVYVGTIILFMINWFFVQRIMRAQHPRLGWSNAYRVFHRGALFVLIMTLIMLIVSSIWQFFTVNHTKLRVFRILQLTGQTYFTVFCIGPAALIFMSILLPRHEIEKFGAGRLRINIIILLIAVAVLTTGQLYRCVITWVPQTPVRDVSGHLTNAPKYLSRPCFYIFNFVTEIVVVILFAVVRVDLRFHVPDGSRISGDYSGRNSRVDLNSRSSVNVNRHAHVRTTTNEKRKVCEAPVVPMTHRNSSVETLHKYETSVFEDSYTLADSLKYGSSTLEVDNKTGAWKVKRSSIGSVSSTHGSTLDSTFSSQCPTPVHPSDRAVKFFDEAPPVPGLPATLSISNTQPPRFSTTPDIRSNPPSRRGTPKRTFELENHGLNDVDAGGAVTDALAALEHNSVQYQEHPRFSATPRASSEAPSPTNDPSAVPNDKKHRAPRNPLAPRQRATFPPKSALKMPRSHNSISTTTSQTTSIAEAPESPEEPKPTRSRHTRRSSSVEFISLAQKPVPSSRKLLDLSLQGEFGRDISRPDSAQDLPTYSTPSAVSFAVGYDPSTVYSDAASNVATKSKAVTGNEASRFNLESFTAVPESGRDMTSVTKVI
ncbi:hypothetical protein DE146DRAFT_755315 [Phaeosphaeria sp. MPI-PUGE-AT-0046c]|nr:hypothetical protein DE146DRAFT_755315 [Phaeosphaeria sp. MPI-PUGE-AT-0046c]